jgi:asparagine synthase (glutamine-hydrolysing)
LPDSYKLYGKVGKHILREFMKDKIPQQIINRKKMGFPVPLTSWFRGKLFQRSQDLLLSERALERGYFKKEYIAGLFKKIKNKEDLGRRIFSLVALELWQRKYID